VTVEDFTRAIRDLYLRLPNTHRRFTTADRSFAAALHQRGTPLDTIQAALLLATARRLCRNPAAAPLPPVRSLHYFLPVIEEVCRQPLPDGYLRYLKLKIARFK
jgi:hypothetical protein